MTTIEVRNVSLDAPDGRRLLDDVSLSVPSGSRLAVCGPPGAGKTALMRVLVGLDEHTDGDVLIDGDLVNSASPRQRDLALVFSDYALHPHLDVYDNLAFAARLRRGSNRNNLDDRVEEVAEFLALGHLLDDKPADLDDSQRQRVAIGRALVRDAAGYLFDEPFTAQDDRVRSHVRSVTTRWQTERNRTSIFTTSDVQEALSLADRVAVMHQGYVHQVGSPRDLYDRPHDVFVASFLGSPSMNLVPARVSGGQLVLPFANIALDESLRRRVGDRDWVIVGIRPELCYDANSPEGREINDRVDFTTLIDDVEWRPKTQLVYLGYELPEEVEETLAEIEDILDFDLFQNFFVAELSAGSDLRAGMTARIVVPREGVHLFDAETGESLTHG
ncbi:ABC transporter ATP-binding protein [Aeromicrobium sp.]|uniref:ABC transporter ATP-binding protein n=1 Tax=Aeromicrobium sp. TaxID=1871063 RepID=UPI003D6BED9E